MPFIWTQALHRRRRWCNACFRTSTSRPACKPQPRIQDRFAGMAARSQAKLPVYKVVGTTGVAHQQSFEVECTVSELRLVEARHRRIAPCGRAGCCRRHAPNLDRERG